VDEVYSHADMGEKRPIRMNGPAWPIKMVIGCRRDTCTVVEKIGTLWVMDVSEG
jgi:hypothetical protein